MRLAPIIAIAQGTLQDLYRRRVVLAACLFALFLSVDTVRALDRAWMYEAAGDPARGFSEKARVVASFGEGLMLLAVALAVILGATAVHRDVATGIAPQLLSRPLSGAAFVVGKALGTVALTQCFAIAGVVATVVAAWLLGVELSLISSLALMRICVVAFVAATLSTGLGAVLPPALAGVLAAFLVIAPELARPLLEHWSPTVRLAAQSIVVISPSSVRSDLLLASLLGSPAGAPHLLCIASFLENLAYGASSLALGAFGFPLARAATRRG